MSQNTHELKLGATWELNAQVYLNFVKWLVWRRGAQQAPHPRMLEEVTAELSAWNLTIQGNSVHGSQEDLAAWILTYS